MERVTAALHPIAPAALRLPMYSTVRGELLPAGAALDAGYWRDNLRGRVRFADAVRRAHADGYRCFLEASPHPVLVPALLDTLAELGDDAVAFGSLRKDGEDPGAEIYRSLSQLWGQGFAPDFRALVPEGRATPLPPYPWDRERLWVDEPATDADEAAPPAPARPAAAVTARAPTAATAVSRVLAHAAAVRGGDPGRIGADLPYRELGFDSVMLSELRRRLEREFGVTLSSTIFWVHPSLSALAGHLDPKLGAGAAPAPAASPTDGLSDAQVVAMLDAKLSR